MTQKVKYSSEKLIDLVRQKPQLWNRKYLGGSNKKQREEMWRSISDAFLSPEIDARDFVFFSILQASTCKHRWQLLRKTRTTALQKAFRNAITNPGQVTRPHKIVELMSFLGDFQPPDFEKLSKRFEKKGTTLMDDTQDSDVEDQHEQSTSTSSEPTNEISLPKKDDDNWELDDANLQEMNVTQAPLFKPKNHFLLPQDENMEPDNSGIQEVGTSQQSDDSIDKRRVGEYELWCKSLACRLDKMKPETASLLMLKAQTLIHEAEFGELSK